MAWDEKLCLIPREIQTLSCVSHSPGHYPKHLVTSKRSKLIFHSEKLCFLNNTATWIWGKKLLKLLDGFNLKMNKIFVRFAIEKCCLSSGFFYCKPGQANGLH